MKNLNRPTHEPLTWSEMPERWRDEVRDAYPSWYEDDFWVRCWYVDKDGYWVSYKN